MSKTNAVNWLFLVVLPCFVFAGCGSKQTTLGEDFWKNTNSKIAIVIDTPEHGEFYQRGDQGALEVLITDAMSKEGKYAKSLKDSRFSQIKETFQKEIAKSGFESVVYPNDIEIESLTELEGKEKGFYKYDLSEIFEKTNCDKIILLQLVGFGISRTYVSLVPASKPQAVSIVHGLMVDRQDNRILWDSDLRDGKIYKEIIGPWKEPPSYPNMTNAIERAIEESKMCLTQKFFHDRLSESTIDSWEQTLAELRDPNTTSIKINRYLWGMETVGPVDASCNKPYKLTQDCSGWSGAIRKVQINGIKAKISGTADGKVVLVMGPKLIPGKREDILAALEASAQILEANNIKILKVVGIILVEETREMQGYYLELDKDGYSVLSRYSAKW